MKKQTQEAESRIEPLYFSEELARAVIDSLSAHIAILDENGLILEYNRAWQAYSVKNGMPENVDFKGMNYLGVCDSVTGEDASDAHNIAKGIRQVINGEITEFLFDYPCHTPNSKHWYYMRAIRMSDTKPVRVIISHEDITALKLVEEALRESREELEEQKQSLEEANIALKVLIKQRENDKLELERNVLTNVKKLVFPYVEKLKEVPLKPRNKTIVEIIENHLKDIISPLLQKFSNAQIILTPQEIKVVSLIKDGKSSKEIADILNISETTVNFHRKNLRRKFGLKNRQMNLRSYLMTMNGG
ncbi:MAG: PAS domain-containing protein [Deltaproteobacteria bacterium]|nr:PAS domain-containing protein [Deltaproteobacteria bacterium]